MPAPTCRYLPRTCQGFPCKTCGTDIPPIGAWANERVGYPTQKPLALLERIIKASSSEGDFVLDPFCGCATACVAAEQLGRRWVGIDISPKAVELVNMRLKQAMGDLFHHRYVTARTDIPRRTDVDAPRNYRLNKHVLFGQQEGLCAGCGVMFPFRNFTVDHVVPRSRGGTDHLDNLQLLCGACNSLKGDRPQEYLMAKLEEMGKCPRDKLESESLKGVTHWQQEMKWNTSSGGQIVKFTDEETLTGVETEGRIQLDGDKRSCISLTGHTTSYSATIMPMVH